MGRHHSILSLGTDLGKDEQVRLILGRASTAAPAARPHEVLVAPPEPCACSSRLNL